MAKALSVKRTATFAWSPLSTPEPRPLLATGTVSGALDASFSNEAQLELWDPFAELDELGQLAVRASIKTSARFNRLAWGYIHPPDRPRGVIAAGFENGELSLYDPARMLAQRQDDVVIYKHTQHSGPVRGLDFNRLQLNLLASGATNGEIFIWDLTNPQKPYSPGSRSRNLEDITSLAWNANVAHVLATSSSSGYTVVWDLKGKREVVALNNSQANVNAMQGGAPAWMATGMAGGRRGGVSAVCWHPENPTKLATASDDDLNPVIMLWDLRNAMAPEKVLSGHEKGILGLSWCRYDSDLLLSSSKDCRTLCWNPTSGEVVGELPASSNWAFETEFCPRNPGQVAVASFDGQIDIRTLQSTLPAEVVSANQPTGADIFEGGNLNAQQRPIVSLKQTPRWLRRPASACFGFGGKVVSAAEKVAAPGAPRSSTVRVRQVVTEGDIVERALKLENASETGELATFCDARASTPSPIEGSAASWQLLRTLFRADSREELVSLLGFSKEEVRTKVSEAIRAFKTSTSGSDRQSLPRSASELALQPQRRPSTVSDSGSIAREPLVTFAETIAQQDALSGSSEGEAAAAGVEGAPSETSATATSEATKFAATEGAATESELTEPSLFGDEPVATTVNQQQAAAEFYSSIRSGRPAALPDHVFGAHAAGSSVAATIGSRASSVASDKLSNTKPSTFRIYPQDESEADRLLTRALVLGDFESAVSLCLSSERFADAILLAVRGGPDLLARTQKAYFERRTTALPYLRLFQSVVSDDLDDIVQNADLAEWQEIFVVLCTFAKPDDFAGLAEQLGHRLEFQAGVSRGAQAANADDLRKHAVLCYLAAGRLEKVVTIWIEEMREQEQAMVASEAAASYMAAHASALQSLIEKVTIFQSAVRYVDMDLAQPTGSAIVAQSGARTYKLAPLYDRYREYAELLAGQGLTTLALRYIALTPSDYRGPQANLDVLTRLAGTTAPALTAKTPVSAKPVAAVPANLYQPAQTYAYNSTPAAPPTYPSAYMAYSAQQNVAQPGGQYPPAQAMAPPAAPYQQAPSAVPGAVDYGYNAYATVQNGSYVSPGAPQNGPYGPTQPFNSISPQQMQQAVPSSFLPAPPPPLGGSPASQQPGVFANQQASVGAPPPPRAKAEGAWNDAPAIQKRAGSAMGQRPGAIVSPFPNQQPLSPGLGPAQGFPGGATAPPPPRGATRTPVGGATFSSPPPPMPRGQPAVGHPIPQPGGQYRSPPMGQGNFPLPQQTPGGPGFQPRPQGPPQQQFMAPPNQRPAFASGPAPSQPQANGFTPAPAQPGPYDPPAGGVPNVGPPRGPPGPMARPSMPSQSFGPAGGPPMQQGTSPAPAPLPLKPEPPKPKYPPGDRNHFTAATRPIFEILSQKMQRLRQIAPQKKMVDDTDRRLNLLFDLLNCETISASTVEQVRDLSMAIDSRNPGLALKLHLELLTQGGAKTDELAAWQTALKVVAQRCGEL